MFAGSRSEKLPMASPAQAKLGLPELPQQEPKTQIMNYERRAPASEKRPMPAEVFAQLPVLETIELIPDEVQAEPDAFEKISEERTFEVEIIGPKLVKREFVRPKFRRKAEREAARVIAPAVPRPVVGGYASAGRLAYGVISK
jgi:transposase